MIKKLNRTCYHFFDRVHVSGFARILPIEPEGTSCFIFEDRLEIFIELIG